MAARLSLSPDDLHDLEEEVRPVEAGDEDPRVPHAAARRTMSSRTSGVAVAVSATMRGGRRRLRTCPSCA